MENKQLVLMDGTECLLLGVIPQFSAGVGDLVEHNGDIYKIINILPPLVSEDMDTVAFIRNLYAGLAEREVVAVDTIYYKRVITDD